jgi:hypothetical protein
MGAGFLTDAKRGQGRRRHACKTDTRNGKTEQTAHPGLRQAKSHCGDLVFPKAVSATAGTVGKPKLIINSEPVAGVPLSMAVIRAL